MKKKKIEKETIVRTAVLAFALINQVLTISGYSPLPFTDDGVGQAVSMALTAAASAWAWWKNNSFTQPAITADEHLKALKSK
ncbi:phage holin [Parablautia intestinalis]|uniref:Phage holin n=1 Tax=Parablautia intestinalis TaxID=2320100 RepID=A0A3A9AGA2_9FIRM|nr:phage holin [Parablautia intestinalis]RKI90417.1 phage holin [Parablautia intestinalis]